MGTSVQVWSVVIALLSLVALLPALVFVILRGVAKSTEEHTRALVAVLEHVERTQQAGGTPIQLIRDEKEREHKAEQLELERQQALKMRRLEQLQDVTRRAVGE